jgi:hypothetical protein
MLDLFSIRSIAICGSEITTVGRLPIQIVNIPPYFCDKASSWTHGHRLSRSSLLPIMGRGCGPGGILRHRRKSWIVIAAIIHTMLIKTVGSVIEERIAFTKVCEDIVEKKKDPVIRKRRYNREFRRGAAIALMCGGNQFSGEIWFLSDRGMPRAERVVWPKTWNEILKFLQQRI